MYENFCLSYKLAGDLHIVWNIEVLSPLLGLVLMMN